MTSHPGPRCRLDRAVSADHSSVQQKVCGVHESAESTVQAGDRYDVGDLLTRCAQGDQVAFAFLYDAIVGRVHGLSVRVLRDHLLAEDVTHESLMEVWRCASRFDSNKGSAHAWILTIAHRQAVTRVRSATASFKREASYLSPNHTAEYDSTGELSLRNTEDESGRSAVRRLRPLQRQAIELAYFEGLTYSEVAAVLGIPGDTAKSRIRDGLICLRAEWSHKASSVKARENGA